MRFIETTFADWLMEPEPIRDDAATSPAPSARAPSPSADWRLSSCSKAAPFQARKGTLRGMHYQTAPHIEVKIVSCVAGAIYDVIVDLRPASATYRGWQGFELSAENERQLYVPGALPTASRRSRTERSSTI
jgi:dTDP-4-dehydrorhamnose 3,5-epimerase